MTIRIYKKSAKPRGPKPRRHNHIDGPKKQWCRPKLLFSLDGKSVLTQSKWFPNQGVAIYDWLQRGFICIDDPKIGGGFEYRDFPVPDLNALVKKYHDKFKKED